MRHGKRDGTDAPRPVPERLGNQNRAKQTDNANENGTSRHLYASAYLVVLLALLLLITTDSM